MGNFLSGILSNITGFTSRWAEKQFYNSSYRWVGNSGAVWVDTDVPRKLFYEIPELNQVINKKADMFVNGIFKIVDDKTNKEDTSKEAKAILDLLKNPNLAQSQNQWLRQYLQQFSIYGNQFIKKNNPTGMKSVPVSLINVSPAYTAAMLTGKFFNQVDIEGIIKHYEYEQGNLKTKFKTKDVLWTKNDDVDDPLMGISPLKSLKFPLTNTKLAYQYLNVISGEKGAIGMISTTNKDSMGAIPTTPEQKKAVNDQFTNDNGVQDGQTRVIQVDGTVTWQPMTYETSKLLLLEQIDANKLTIVDHYGLNINIFSSKNQTFENVRNALIQGYNDSIIPFADALTQSLTPFLGTPKGKSIILDYSHLGILQEDEGTPAEILKKQLDSVSQAVSTGLISPDQAHEILNGTFGLNIVGGAPEGD